MSLGRRQSPRKAIRDWLAHAEAHNDRKEAAKAVQDNRMGTPRRDHGCDLSRLHKSRTQTAGRPGRRLSEDENLEGEEQTSHDMRSSLS